MHIADIEPLAMYYNYTLPFGYSYIMGHIALLSPLICPCKYNNLIIAILMLVM